MKKLNNAINHYGQSNLAKDAGVSKAMVSLVVAGKRTFGKKSGQRVSHILDIPLSVALGMDNQ